MQAFLRAISQALSAIDILSDSHPEDDSLTPQFAEQDRCPSRVTARVTVTASGTIVSINRAPMRVRRFGVTRPLRATLPQPADLEDEPTTGP